MSQSQAELRTTRRFALRLPMSVRYSNGGVHEVDTQTKDVSARGVFFYMDSNLKAGSEVEFTLTLPPEITLTENIRVRCKGRVVRVDDQAGTKVGVAAMIDQYEFLAES